MNIIITFIASSFASVFLIMPAALGYWYMEQPNAQAISIPLQFWVVPVLATIVLFIVSNID